MRFCSLSQSSGSGAVGFEWLTQRAADQSAGMRLMEKIMEVTTCSGLQMVEHKSIQS